MKVILIFALLSLSVFAKDCEGTASSFSDCESLVTEVGYTCCYIEQKGTIEGEPVDEKYCGEVPSTIVDKLDDYIDTYKAEAKSQGATIDKYEVDCHSKYLNIAFFALLFLLF